MEPPISGNGACKLCIKILLVGCTGPKSFLPQHLTKRDLVVVRIDTHKVPSLWIASFKLTVGLI